MTHPIKDSFAPLCTHKAHDQQIHKHVLGGCSDVTVTGDHCPNKIGLDLSVKEVLCVLRELLVFSTLLLGGLTSEKLAGSSPDERATSNARWQCESTWKNRWI
ncbi:hypothetical protein PO909_004973 [Leuciscus waleckii]